MLSATNVQPSTGPLGSSSNVSLLAHGCRASRPSLAVQSPSLSMSAGLSVSPRMTESSLPSIVIASRPLNSLDNARRVTGTPASRQSRPMPRPPAVPHAVVAVCVWSPPEAHVGAQRDDASPEVRVPLSSLAMPSLRGPTPPQRPTQRLFGTPDEDLL